ncbi:unnamed protein product [Meloidogyne enterolobii]|uniref:Uncharacterized protein n=1 Tax=Meloidogyne enterolobii TaxID=390850 RepID=A0ACB0YRT8_MELEN
MLILQDRRVQEQSVALPMFRRLRLAAAVVAAVLHQLRSLTLSLKYPMAAQSAHLVLEGLKGVSGVNALPVVLNVRPVEAVPSGRVQNVLADLANKFRIKNGE